MAYIAILLRHLIFALILVLALSNETGVSREEYLKMKEYLRSRYRPYVKSIKTEHGQIFDCVDIHRQPGLGNRNLSNHIIEMISSSKPERVGVAPSTSETRPNIADNSDDKCPPLTVPILRVTMEDLLRAGSVSRFLSRRVSEPSNERHKYAGLILPTDKCYGTGVAMRVENPKVGDKQFSLAQIWIYRGTEEKAKDFIEVGWQVYPKIYGDDKTHIFVLWTKDHYEHYCYNTECPGFVLTTRDPAVTPGKDSSITGELAFDVIKHKESGDWVLWLTHPDTSTPPEIIGYWPNMIFTDTELQGFADHVAWGGEAYRTSGDTNPFPPVGSGKFADDSEAAYIRKITLFNEDGRSSEAPKGINNYKVAQTKDCYTVKFGDTEQEGWGTYFYYGGPGGQCDGQTSAEPLLQVV